MNKVSFTRANKEQILGFHASLIMRIAGLISQRATADTPEIIDTQISVLTEVLHEYEETCGISVTNESTESLSSPPDQAE